MAYSMDPREDLAWLDAELTKSLAPDTRRRLEEARERAVKSVAELEAGIVCPDCEEGPDKCVCVAYDDVRAVNGGVW